MLSRITDLKIAWYVAATCSILYLSIFLGILLFSTAHGIDTEQLYAIHHFDTGDYTSLAQTIVMSGKYALTSFAPPHFLRMPGYPTFLALVYAIFSNFLFVPIIQILFTAATSAIIYLIGSKHLSRTVSILVALAYMIDPVVIFETWAILSETLFMLLLFGTIYLISVRMRRWWLQYILAGALLGVAILTRPVGQYLAPIVASMIFVYEPWRRALVGVVMILATTAVVISPWIIRTYELSGHIALSSQTAPELFQYAAPTFEEWRTGTPYTRVQDTLFKQLGTRNDIQIVSWEYAPKEETIAMGIIGAHPFLYLLFHIEKSAELYIGSSFNFVRWQTYVYGLNPTRPASNGAWSMLETHRWKAAFAQVFNNAPAFVERLFWLAMIVGTIGTFIRALRDHSNNPIWIIFTVAFICIVALLTGPISDDTRFRMPAEPFLFMLGFNFWYIIYYRYSLTKSLYGK